MARRTSALATPLWAQTEAVTKTSATARTPTMVSRTSTSATVRLVLMAALRKGLATLPSFKMVKGKIALVSKSAVAPSATDISMASCQVVELSSGTIQREPGSHIARNARLPLSVFQLHIMVKDRT